MLQTTTIPPQEYVRLEPAAMSKWPDNDVSVGTGLYPLGRNRCWEVNHEVGPVRDISKAIFDATRILLNSRSDYVNEGEREQCMVIFGLYMVGKTRMKARPTLLFSCERRGPRQRAIRLANNEDLLKDFPFVKLAESSRPPLALQTPMLLFAGAKDIDDNPMAGDLYTGALGSPEIYYLPNNSSCGTLLMVRYGADPGMVRIATLGGIIWFRGKCFGLTAAHVFSGAYDPEYLSTQGDSEFAFDAASDESSGSDEEGLIAMMSEGSISSSSISSTTSKEQGRIPIKRDIRYFSDPSLWQENASSSTDKWQNFGSIRSALGHNGADWALIEVENRTFTAKNLISWEQNGQQRSLYPQNVATETPADRCVALATGLNGVLEGRISKAASYVLLPGSINYQEVWAIYLSSCLGKGNSGTWVVDFHNGNLLGHIVAGHPESIIAYMVPAATIFLQLERAFGGKFGLVPTESSMDNTSTAPASGAKPTYQNQAGIDPQSLHEQIVDYVESINADFEFIIHQSLMSTPSLEIMSVGKELNGIYYDFKLSVFSATTQALFQNETVSMSKSDSSYLFDWIYSLGPLEQRFMRDTLSGVKPALRSIATKIKNHAIEGPSKASIREPHFPESAANPSQDLKWIKVGINAMKHVLSPSLEFDRLSQIIAESSASSLDTTQSTADLVTSPSGSGSLYETEIGTTLDVIIFSDQCLEYGSKFVKISNTYLASAGDQAGLPLDIEINWIKIKDQIKTLKTNAPRLDERFQDIAYQMLSPLVEKLKTAALTIEGLIIQNILDEKSGGTTRAKVLGMTRGESPTQLLQRTVEEMRTWQTRYNPTWAFIMRISRIEIDNKLELQQSKAKTEQIPLIMATKEVRNAEKVDAGLDNADLKSEPLWSEQMQPKMLQPEEDLPFDWPMLKIPHSSAWISARKSEEDSVLIERLQFRDNSPITNMEVHSLARVLAGVNPFTFGQLKCRQVTGVFPESIFPIARGVVFRFEFDIPRGLSDPQSLRAMLLARGALPLHSRLEMARKLASSILFLPTALFLRKSIRPETIIVFENDDSDTITPFLTGFEQSDISGTYLVRDETWVQNLYRHPIYQGAYIAVAHKMKLDIYSLGVVLLEIGLWRSFTSDDSTASAVPGYQIVDRGSVSLASRLKNKYVLEDMAERELPSHMGKKYRDIVLWCMRCLDDEEGWSMDADEIEDGVSYIQNVLEKIHEISL